ncbi:tumorous testis [Cochliomyia hominivorax]
MSMSINAQMWSYVHSLFEHPSKWYESYQENGTKYLKRRQKLEDHLQQQLNACVGEIFLCGIPPDTRAEQIAEIASFVGELYILRFKVHFSGASRGYAYLQYVDPNLMSLALKKLPLLFRELKLPTIKVCESRNSSKLLLRKTFKMSPLMVFETLKSIIKFNKLVGREIFPGYFEYQIVFKCNEEAVHARREILKSILKFGPKAAVVWDTSSFTKDNQSERIFQRTPSPFNPQYQVNRMLRVDDGGGLATVRSQVMPQQNFCSGNFLNDFSKMNLY